MLREKALSFLFVEILLIVFVTFLANTVFAQDATWVSIQLPGNFPNNYHHQIGETCYIFVDDTSNIIYSFSTYSGQWHTYAEQTDSDWNGTMADGNVAMVWNDTTVVVFNAITGNFSSLPGAGGFIMNGADHGCIENFAYLLGPSVFYVFDASDDSWHTFNYTVPGNPGATIQGGVFGDKDYIYLHLTVLNDYPSTITAYSLRTHTFVETTEENIQLVETLDHGFTFDRTGTTPYLCGGYSAYTGSFDIKTSPEYINRHPSNTWPSHVSPNILTMFTRDEFINTVDYRHYIWVYNTLTGNFHEHSYIIDTGYEHRGTYCGGQLAIDLLEDIPGPNRIECILFYPDYGTFTSFFTYLYYWGFMDLTTGGQIFNGYDDTTYYVYDINVNQYYKHSVNWTSGYLPNPGVNPIGNYWSVFGYQPVGEDTFHVYSYTRTLGSLNSFDVRSSGNTTGSGNGGLDLFWMTVQDPSTHNKMFIYAPLYGTWIEKDMTSASYFGGKGNYCYINLTNQNQTYFYDGQTNQEYLFPSAQVQSYVVANDSIFFMYSNAGKYIGYSIIQHDTSEYVTAKLSHQHSGKYIILNNEGSDHLLYDGYNNIFLPLTLNSTHGTPRNTSTGGKTAVVMSANGYLFAYAPGISTPIEDKMGDEHVKLERFKLNQNYPNPFNPSTTIEFNLPKSSEVSLKVYNILGEEVATLLSASLLSGSHSVEWDVSNLASGVYLYRLQAGDYVETRKMVVMK